MRVELLINHKTSFKIQIMEMTSLLARRYDSLLKAKQRCSGELVLPPSLLNKRDDAR